ncbi:MAG TPA: MFS transporter [Acidobacteriaceae bacterium]|nr:MFS transporter [Acidobacteriaceae bacterium]
MEIEAQRPRGLPIRYLLVVWLMILSALAYVDRTNISIAAIAIEAEFGISKVTFGHVLSIFLIGYAAFQIPAGLFARRLGPRRSLALLGAWWGVFLALIGCIPYRAANALLLLMLLRFALGVGEAVMYPAATQFVERWFPAGERGRANGIVFAGVGLGSCVTPFVVSRILAHHGWRTSFVVNAVAGAIAGLIWFFAARDTPEQHRAVSVPERDLILRERRNTIAARAAVPWARIARSRPIYAMLVSYFAYGYIVWIFFGWMYTYMAEVRGVNLKTSALYTALPFVAMTIGCLSGGAVCDWIAAHFGLRLGRCGLPAIAFALTAALLLAGSAAHSSLAAALLLAAGVGALYLSQSSYWAVCADIAGENTSVVAGIVNMSGQIGGAVTASLTPLLAAHFGWETSFATAAALAAVGALAWLAVDPRCAIETELLA